MRLATVSGMIRAGGFNYQESTLKLEMAAKNVWRNIHIIRYLKRVCVAYF